MIKIKTIETTPRTMTFDQVFDVEDMVYAIADLELYPMVITDYVVGSLGIRYLCKGADLEDGERIYYAIELTKTKPIFDKEDLEL